LTVQLLQRQLGPYTVSAIGLGCMNLSHAYGVPPTPEAAAAVLRGALDCGVTHFDTAALYGFGANEELLGRTLAAHRSRFTLASKCGIRGVKTASVAVWTAVPIPCGKPAKRPCCACAPM
jgi:aryl-alcohol dehydrogenase-like predicted oxidoreductase